METIIINTTESNKLEQIIAFLNSINVSFEIKKDTKKEDKPYDLAFVKKILERSESAKRGNVVEYTSELKHQWFGK